VRALAPGQSLELARRLRPGDGDIAKTANAIIAERPAASAQIFGVVYDTSPQRRLVANARVRLDEIRRVRGDATASAPRAHAQTRSNSAGEFRFQVPPGEYVVRGSEPTRFQAPRAASQRLVAGAVVETEMFMAPPYRLAFDVRDEDTGEPIPCKITVSPARN